MVNGNRTFTKITVYRNMEPIILICISRRFFPQSLIKNKYNYNCRLRNRLESLGRILKFWRSFKEKYTTMKAFRGKFYVMAEHFLVVSTYFFTIFRFSLCKKKIYHHVPNIQFRFVSRKVIKSIRFHLHF